MEHITNKEAFVYCWSDFGTNKLYVGVHKGIPEDGYVCSSKPMLENYTQRPNDFSRQILASGTYREMHTFETAILKASKADRDPGFYNMTLNHGPFYCKGPHSKEHIEKRIAPLRGRKRSQEAINKTAAKKRGVPVPTEVRARISATLRAKCRKASEETKYKQSIALKGRPLSKVNRENLKGPRERIFCPECGLVGGISNMKRFHFDNCKMRRGGDFC